MKIYEYRRHLIGGEIKDPEFIVNGGFWYDEETDTYIAAMPDQVGWYVPDSLTVLSQEELVTRVKKLNRIKPWPKRRGVLGSGGRELPGTQMTDADVEEMVLNWLLIKYI